MSKMTNHKMTAFALYDDAAAYVATIVNTTVIQVFYHPDKGWIVVE
jgi:hypothetical protein